MLGEKLEEGKQRSVTHMKVRVWGRGCGQTGREELL